MLPGGSKKANFLEIGNFERPPSRNENPSATKFSRFTRRVGGLVDKNLPVAKFLILSLNVMQYSECT